MVQIQPENNKKEVKNSVGPENWPLAVHGLKDSSNSKLSEIQFEKPCESKL